MTAPAFLSSTYRYLSVQNITDVSTIISTLDTELVAAGWTSNGGGSYTSPVDAAGRFHTDVFTRVSQGVLSMLTKDQGNVTISTSRLSINISAGFSNIVIFMCGQYHLHVEAQLPDGTFSYLASGILDESPEAQNAHNKYVYHQGSLNSGGTAQNSNVFYLWMIDNATPGNVARVVDFVQNNNNAATRLTLSGNPIMRAKEVACSTAILTLPIAGRLYQHLFVPNTVFRAGAIVQLPIDGATLGTFYVCGGPAGSWYYQAVRIG